MVTYCPVSHDVNTNKSEVRVSNKLKSPEVEKQSAVFLRDFFLV